MAKVLVVEDDPDSMEVVKLTLERAGHLTLSASNGWEGLLMLDAQHVDVIVLDLMMPGMNGIAFLRILRNDQRRKDLPVIILTALNNGETLRAVADLGVQAWLLKADYTSKQLMDTVERLAHPAVRHSPPADHWQNVRCSEHN